MVTTWKDTFQAKVEKATDSQLKNGFGILKRNERLANEQFKTDQEKVEQLLQNQTYLDALDAVEQDKVKLSELAWKKGAVIEEIEKRVKETEEKTGTF